MSGGVDSSVAAALLSKQGYDCSGVFYELWSPEPKLGKAWENNCCSLEAYQDAQKVAKKLGIPLFRSDISKDFKKLVVDYFIEEYKAGRTPNPCVVCNTKLRFGAMLNKALNVYKADYLATGHYAIRDHQNSWKSIDCLPPNKKAKLLRAHDRQKDQTYFLYRLGQSELNKILFPLGGMQKSEVRALAKKMGLPTASKHDSQEVCFVPKGEVAKFLKTQITTKSGTITDKKGNKLGKHQGAELYTLGQRRGLGALGQKPHYVVSKDVKKNKLVVTDNPAEVDMTNSIIDLQQVSFVGSEPKMDYIYQARGRHVQALFRVKLRMSGSRWQAIPQAKIDLLATGQSLVLYDNEEVIGGGIIKNISKQVLKSSQNEYATIKS